MPGTGGTPSASEVSRRSRSRPVLPSVRTGEPNGVVRGERQAPAQLVHQRVVEAAQQDRSREFFEEMTPTRLEETARRTPGEVGQRAAAMCSATIAASSPTP